MISEYAQEVLEYIKFQEFYEEVEENTDSEVFEDIMDFMEQYCPDWYKNLDEWASEFINFNITCYIDLYDDPEMTRAEVLKNLYLELKYQYKEFLFAWEIAKSEVEAYKL
jgi:hypothetical protein